MIIFKSKVLLPHAWLTLVDFGILLVYWPLVYCFQTLLNYLALQYVDSERTWWRLFQKWIVLSKFDIYVVFRQVHCLEVCQGFANTLWTETFAMGPYDNGFTNTLWTQTIVRGPYDKGFTNTFWTETPVMGPYGKGLQTLCERMTPSLWMGMTMEPRTLWRDIRVSRVH